MENREYRETEPRMNECSHSKRKRRRYQFSLRTLLALTTLFAVFCSWYAYEMRKAAKRRMAIAEIIRLDGKVVYYRDNSLPRWGKPPEWYSWLRKLHGDEYLGNAVVVFLFGEDVTDDALVHVKGLTSVEKLDLGGPRITDAGLVHIRGMTHVRSLDLSNTQITGAGLVHLGGMTNLQDLSLWYTQVGDNGLVHLNELTQLQELDVGYCSQVTDAGLEHLKGMANLRWLNLDRTSVSHEGVEKLREALPECSINTRSARVTFAQN